MTTHTQKPSHKSGVQCGCVNCPALLQTGCKTATPQLSLVLTCSVVFSTGAAPRPISGLRLVSRTSLGVPNQRSNALAADLVPSRAAHNKRT